MSSINPNEFWNKIRILGLLYRIYVKRKISKALDVIKVDANSKWGVDKITLFHLYRSLAIHLQGHRVCLGAFRTSPVDSLYVEANEPPLDLLHCAHIFPGQ